MDDNDEPSLVTSGKNHRVTAHGYLFSVEIYRLETEKTWSLEVIDHEGAGLDARTRS